MTLQKADWSTSTLYIHLPSPRQYSGRSKTQSRQSEVVDRQRHENLTFILLPKWFTPKAPESLFPQLSLVHQVHKAEIPNRLN